MPLIENWKAPWRRWLFYLECKCDNLLGAGGVSESGRKGRGHSGFQGMTYPEKQEKEGQVGQKFIFILLLGYNTPSKSSSGGRRALCFLTGSSLSLSEVRARTQAGTWE